MVNKVKLLWYPWLDNLYNKITSLKNIRNINFNLIITYTCNLSVDILILELVKWFFCVNIKDNKCCNFCLNCNLIKKDNYPNFNYIKDSSSILVSDIREIVKNLCVNFYINNIKIIYFSKFNFLNHFIFNSLLKLMEDFNYFIFIFSCHESVFIPTTILSRCYRYKLICPTEKVSYIWLNKFVKLDKIIILTAIRISNSSPLLSYFLLKKLWKDRIFFFKNIKEILFESKFILLDKKLIKYNLYWLLTFIHDIIKYKINNFSNISNLDQINNVIFLSKYFSLKHVFLIFIELRSSLCNLKLIKGININILLSNLFLFIKKLIIIH